MRSLSIVISVNTPELGGQSVYQAPTSVGEPGAHENCKTKLQTCYGSIGSKKWQYDIGFHNYCARNRSMVFRGSCERERHSNISHTSSRFLHCLNSSPFHIIPSDPSPKSTLWGLVRRKRKYAVCMESSTQSVARRRTKPLFFRS